MAKKTKPLRSYRHQEASRVNLPTEEASASGEEAAPIPYTPPPGAMEPTRFLTGTAARPPLMTATKPPYSGYVKRCCPPRSSLSY